MKTFRILYRTSDGMIFDDETAAVIHDQCECFAKYGEFGHYEKIDRSYDNGETWE